MASSILTRLGGTFTDDGCSISRAASFIALAASAALKVFADLPNIVLPESYSTHCGRQNSFSRAIASKISRSVDVVKPSIQLLELNPLTFVPPQRGVVDSGVRHALSQQSAFFFQ